MDVCYHPDDQPLHGYTSWYANKSRLCLSHIADIELPNRNGPRPGVLFPLFSWTASTLNADLLLPALEQYERPVGPDPAWKDKKINKAVWRGSTTGSDLSIPHARKHSQRVRLARR